LHEISLKHSLAKNFTLKGEYGILKRDSFKSSRYIGTAQYSPDNMPSLSYSIEKRKNTDELHTTNGDWLLNKGSLVYPLNDNLETSFKIEHENRQIKNKLTDSLFFGSYKLLEYLPAFRIKNIWQLSVGAELGWRIMDSLRTSQAIPSIHTFMQKYTMELHEWEALASKVEITGYSISGKNTSRSNDLNNSFNLRWQTKYSPFQRALESDFYYDVSSERSAKMERVFQRVTIGQGNFKYVGDVNNNKMVDEADFDPTRFDGDYIVLLFPSEQYIPVVNLKGSGRLRVNGSRITQAQGLVSGILNSLSTETYARVEERNTSTQKNNIYFLHFDQFLDDTYTISGNQLLSNDLFLFENNQNLNFRFRFVQSGGMSQYATQNEKTFAKERSVRIRLSFTEDLSNQTEYTDKTDNLFSNIFSTRIRNIKSEALSSDFSYHMGQDFQLGIKFSVGTVTNFNLDQSNLNDQSLRAIYSFKSLGQVRFEFTREEAVVISSSRFIPFELTSGRISGKTWIVRLLGDYRLTQFLQMNVRYEGRIEGAHPSVHTGQAEVKAFF